MDDSKFRKIAGTLANGDPAVIKDFEEALKKIQNYSENKLYAFGIVTVDHDSVATAYSGGNQYFRLLGGLTELQHRIINDSKDD